MTLYDINLGDFSGDGHEKTRTFYLRVDDSVPEETLRANYRANSDLFGFSPSDFAAEYEDSTIPQAMYDTLIANGYQDVPMGDYIEGIADTNDVRPKAGGYYIDPGQMFKIVAFYLTHQPDGNIPWEHWQIESTTLIGWRGVNYDRPGKYSSVGVGYGLFY